MKRIIAGAAAVIVGATVASCGSAADETPASSTTSVGQAARDLGGVFASSTPSAPTTSASAPSNDVGFLDLVAGLSAFDGLTATQKITLAKATCEKVPVNRRSVERIMREQYGEDGRSFVLASIGSYCPQHLGTPS